MLLWELVVKISMNLTNKKAVLFAQADISAFSVKRLTAHQHFQMLLVFMQIAVCQGPESRIANCIHFKSLI